MKSSSPSRRISEEIRERGPITVAAFMDLALYDPHVGYYARAAQRSGRAGDFFTSVDVGPVFGELLDLQIAEMDVLLGGHAGPPLQIHNGDSHSAQSAGADRSLSAGADRSLSVGADRPLSVGADRSLSVGADRSLSVGADLCVGPHLDLIESGAGNGRLAADILRAAKRRDPALYERLRLHLVEASPTARAAQSSTLGDVGERLVYSSATLPDRFEGVLIANELLDALPVHQVVMREDGLREVRVGLAPGSSEAQGDEAFVAVEGAPSTPALQQYLDRIGVTLAVGWRAEINLRAVEWIRDAARRLVRGFIVLIDYGHEARHLYSASHADGTLTTFTRHTTADPEMGSYPFSAPPWLRRIGEQDITSHVDFTSIRAAAEGEGLQTLLFLDQTYFVMGMLNSNPSNPSNPSNLSNLSTLGLRTLLMPGGLGSTHKVLIFGKGVGTPALRGGSFGGRVT